uniref:PDZ domain-containing protein n=1 Tax=Salarias fasciatus TaxID=181472 RepID=A0A672FV06_SALFA
LLPLRLVSTDSPALCSLKGWPEEFGFQLGGNGPSYILTVEEGSSAHLAGLQAGDQVLEIEGHNVSTLGPQAVIAIAQTQKNIPPSIGVVSRIQQVSQRLHPPQQSCMDIIPGPDGRFGFTIVGDCPLLVEDCSPCSPAGRAGLRAGDYVMEVNGIPVRHHEMAAALIKASQGRTLRLGVLGLGPRQKHSFSAEDGWSGWPPFSRKSSRPTSTGSSSPASGRTHELPAPRRTSLGYYKPTLERRSASFLSRDPAASSHTFCVSHTLCVSITRLTHALTPQRACFHSGAAVVR